MVENSHKPGLVFTAIRVLVWLVRILFGLFILAATVWIAVALYGMLRWWNVPILLVFGFCLFVLLRNRWRRC